MPDADLDLLISAAKAAGDVSSRFSGATARRWEKPDGAGPVTEADLAVNAVLHAHLTSARPNYGWLSEESEDDAQRLGKEAVFVVDPIDGTRSFANGDKTWAHALAVVKQGVTTAAAIFLPMRDLLYTASVGAGAWCNGASITASERQALDGASVLAASPALDSRNWDGPAPNIRRAYRPSLAYRMAVVADGAFDAMITLRETWEWDVAAGDLILREAGAICSDRSGAPLRFNNPRPTVNGVLAGGAALHGAMVSGLAKT